MAASRSTVPYVFCKDRMLCASVRESIPSKLITEEASTRDSARKRRPVSSLDHTSSFRQNGEQVGEDRGAAIVVIGQSFRNEGLFEA